MAPNVKVPFELENGLVNVTPIPAYHCPGSFMFLFEGDEKNVLYTGDIRAENWWIEQLQKNPHLFKYTTSLRTLDKIYLDTTFGYRGEPFIQMLRNNDGLNSIIELIKLYPLDADIGFFFADMILGFEECWYQIVSTFGGKLHCGTPIMERLRSLSDYLGFVPYLEDNSYLQNKHQNTPIFHACGSQQPCHQQTTFKVRIKHCIDFNIVDYTGSFFPIPIDSVRDRIRLLRTTLQGNEIYMFQEREWILSRSGTELLPSQLKLVFSRHSSFEECYNFVKLFNPSQVYPCVESQLTWDRGFQMARIFGSICSGGLFDYDLEKKRLWGSPKTLARDNIYVINRWSPEDCAKEAEFVNQALHKSKGGKLPEVKDMKQDLIQFVFRGQMAVSGIIGEPSSKEDKLYRKTRAIDFRLQDLLIGRGKQKFKEFIQGNQKMYLNYTPAKGLFDYSKQDDTVDNFTQAKSCESDYYDSDSDSNHLSSILEDSIESDNRHKIVRAISQNHKANYLLSDEDMVSQYSSHNRVLLSPRLNSIYGKTSFSKENIFGFQNNTIFGAENHVSFQATEMTMPSYFGSVEIRRSTQFTNLDKSLVDYAESMVSDENGAGWFGIGLKSVNQ